MKKLVFALFVFVTTIGFYACSVEEVGPNVLDPSQGIGIEGPGDIGDPIDGGGSLDVDNPTGDGDPDDGGGDGDGDLDGSGSCADYGYSNVYWNGDAHIDGIHAGHGAVFVEVTGGWPVGTTYAWLLTYEDGTQRYYPHSTEKPRKIDVTFENKIVEFMITARYNGCEGSGTSILEKPFPTKGSTAKVGPHFLDKIKIKPKS